jgi:hypothetical protein
MTEVDFSNVVGSGETGYRIAQHIDVSQFRYVSMAVRLHEGSILSGGKIKVGAYADGYTMEDPTKVFSGGAGIELALVDFESQDTAPFYEVVELTTGTIGGLVTIVVSGSQPASPGTLTGTISIDLVVQN